MNFVLWKREDWERYPEDLRPKAEDVIRDLCNWLICSLYEPDVISIFKVDESRVKGFSGLEDTAINWADLACTHVERRGDVYIAYISEAAPRRERSEGLPRDMATGVGLAGGSGDGVVRRRKNDLVHSGISGTGNTDVLEQRKEDRWLVKRF